MKRGEDKQDVHFSALLVDSRSRSDFQHGFPPLLALVLQPPIFRPTPKSAETAAPAYFFRNSVSFDSEGRNMNIDTTGVRRGVGRGEMTRGRCGN